MGKSYENLTGNQMWWYALVILALRRQRPEGQELKASLDYIASQGQPELRQPTLRELRRLRWKRRGRRKRGRRR